MHFLMQVDASFDRMLITPLKYWQKMSELFVLFYNESSRFKASCFFQASIQDMYAVLYFRIFINLLTCMK